MANMVFVAVEIQLVSGTQTDISADVLLPIRYSYGIEGSGPTDVVASAGECHFGLRNDAGNSVGLQGAYSPLHANVRAGWTYGIPIRVVTRDGAATAFSVSSLTRTSTTATVTTSAAHGRATGDSVTIAGAVQTAYNGTVQITVTGATTFTFGVTGAPATPATGTITATQAFIKFRGKVGVIDPEPGRYLTQRVSVVAYDGMKDLLDADVRELSIGISKTESELVGLVLDALPAATQPVARSLDTGVDTYPYAFQNVGGGEKAAGLIKDTVVSALGTFLIRGDGTARYRSRHSRATGTSAFTFTNVMRPGGLTVPSSLDGVYNHVRATIHPTTIDTAATTVLFALSGTAPSIAPGATLTLSGDFRSAAAGAALGTVQTLIGGTEVVSGVLATDGTDYAANSAADGSGTNIRTSVSVTVTAFASTATFVIVNNHATATAYLVNGAGATFLQVRGKGVYDNGPQTYEAVSVQSYGDRPVAFDMPYQADSSIGQSAATYLEAQYRSLTSQVTALGFLGNDSAALMDQALAREPGDTITVTETLTGLSSVEAIIQRVEHEITLGDAGPRVLCRFGLAPAAPFKVWQLGTAGSSEIGTTSILGF